MEQVEQRDYHGHLIPLATVYRVGTPAIVRHVVSNPAAPRDEVVARRRYLPALRDAALGRDMRDAYGQGDPDSGAVEDDTTLARLLAPNPERGGEGPRLSVGVE
jgi:hypothetical protein